MILDIGYLANPYSLVEWINQGCAVYGTRIRAIFEVKSKYFWVFGLAYHHQTLNFLIIFFYLPDAPLKKKILTKISQKGKEGFWLLELGFWGSLLLGFWFKVFIA